MFKFFNLRWFDGEGTAPAGGAAEAGNPAAEEEVGSLNEVAEVKYGKQPEETGMEEDSETKSREEGFKQFKEQYKQEYQAELQSVINKRFKNSKAVEAERDQLREQNESYGSLIELLSEKYGTADVKQLISQISEDDGFLEQKALDAGMPLEDYKRVYGAEKKAEKLQKELDSITAQEEQNKIVEKWQSEAQELLQLYPDFNLGEEINNEKFKTSLINGMSVRDAYQLAHFDDILSGVIQYTADTVKSSVSKAKAERSARPTENGSHHAKASAIVKNDVNKLSKEDMDEIDKRVLRGEKISFS